MLSFSFMPAKLRRWLAQQNHFLPPSYQTNNQTQGTATTKSDMEPEFTERELVRFLCSRITTPIVIELCCKGKVHSPHTDESTRLIIVCTPSLAENIRRDSPLAEVVPWNLEKGLPDRVLELAHGALILCTNVLESLNNPRKLLLALSRASQVADIVLLSTPDRVRLHGVVHAGPPVNRSRLREWSAPEFAALLRDVGLKTPLLGHTRASNSTAFRTVIIAIAGRLATPPRNQLPRCLAIMSTYNDVDIAEYVVSDYIRNGVDLRILDNWSTDGTYEVLDRFQEKHPDSVVVERYPRIKSDEAFYDWHKILTRKQEIARVAKGYEWVLHVDSDELRRPPWAGMTIQQALGAIGSWGFNAVDHTVVNFVPTEDGFTQGYDPEHFFRFFEFGDRPGHFLQVKTWNRHDAPSQADLATSGGHEVQFEGRKVFPLKFLLKHYPLRSIAHAERKLGDRKERTQKERAERGWHTQYDDLYGIAGDQLIMNPRDFIPFCPTFFDSEFVVERLSGIGLMPRQGRFYRQR